MDKANGANNAKENRNYGIDLLRIISMLFVVVLHCLGQGGILKHTVIGSLQYKFSWLMEICAYCAVDVFALISGYVSYREKEKKMNYSNYINLWMEVVFYGLLVTLIFNIVNPGIVSKNDYLIALFPITNGLYWYFTAYTGLFAIMPFLNKAIRKCSNITMKKIFVVIILLFSVFDTISKRFVLASGYTFIWITLLYILGATIKKCEIGKNLKFYKIIIYILILYAITYLYKIYGFKFSIFDIEITKSLLISYTSPTILGVSILYLISFSKMKLHNISKKIIKFAAPSAFAVYLLNNHRLIWQYVMKNLFVDISKQSILIIFAYVVGFSILFVIGSILIDRIRMLIFKIINVNALSNRIADSINKIITKMSKSI